MYEFSAIVSVVGMRFHPELVHTWSLPCYPPNFSRARRFLPFLRVLDVFSSCSLVVKVLVFPLRPFAPFAVNGFGCGLPRCGLEFSGFYLREAICGRFP